MTFWRADPIWQGQACYIIGGGPSLLTQDLTLLKGQNVIVINSSYLAFSDAQFLIFSDMRWWCHHLRNKAMTAFKGRIIGTSSQATGPLVRMRRKTSPGLATEPDTLMVKNTTLTGAINLGVHCGATKMVLLGIDQKAAADGRVHHHPPHPWKPSPDCWKRQQSDLPKIAEDLNARNIECVNASPGSALALWPIVNLEDHVAAADIARVA